MTLATPMPVIQDLDEMSVWADTIYKRTYKMGDETWPETAYRVASNVVGPYFPELVPEITQAIRDRKFMPGGRYLYASGRPTHQINNCFLFNVDDSREGWASLLQRVIISLMTGGGVGVVYSDLRSNGSLVKGMGGTSTGPLSPMQMVNEAGRHIMQGGSRRASMWAGLHWNHPDVFEFIKVKNWSEDLRALKEKDFNFPAPMDMTNVSVILDDDFFIAYDDKTNMMHDWAQRVYWKVCEKMLTTAEPGFSIDVGENAGEHLRNACTELTSKDDNDVCNIGSINLARVETKEEFARLVELSTILLLCGTLYSAVPFDGIAETRTKNRRLGLGLMGIYEWLVKRGYSYDPNDELGEWLEEYAKSTDIAGKYADKLKISRPIKTRAIAPNGTTSIVAQTTSGIEPLFAIAMKRRYLKGSDWHFQYVIDATAQRLIEQGVNPNTLETAYDLANTPERRVAFQAWVQQYVDHGISSTINLPAREDQNFSVEEFGDMLMKYLPQLRGITAYPDGARGGQPLNVVPFEEAYGVDGIEFEEFGSDKGCVSGSCGV
jgi:ribonucleoside-diphosphate reductase alpha chain